MMNHVIIIAEAGVNHNGDIGLAKRLIEKAKDAGADYVKFQTARSPESVTSKFAQMAEYQKKNVKKDESQLEMIRSLTLPLSAFSELKDHCNKVGIKFMSTPFDRESIDALMEVGMDYIKIPSGEITNLPYLRKVAQQGIPVIMSTGMCELFEVKAALDVLYSSGLTSKDVTLLHCNTEYPTPYEDVNLKAMLTLKEIFGVRVGYSDHTKGIEVPVAAVALGATVIEKHFTLDRNLPGPDHVASLEPEELNSMVLSIRNIEKALGNGVKTVSVSEEKNIVIARRSIVAAKCIKKGESFSEDNLTIKRPGNGVSPMKWDDVIGKEAKRDFMEDELIEL